MEMIDKATLLECVSAMSIAEMAPVLSGSFFCTFVIDPWSKRIMFSDRMSELLGEIAYQEIPLDFFYQHIPENERAETVNRYSTIISDLLSSDLVSDEIDFAIQDISATPRRLKIRMQVMKIEKTRYISGLLYDASVSVEAAGFNRFFGDGISSYLFLYDRLKDRIILSGRFVRDFDLGSGIIEDFTNNMHRLFDASAISGTKEIYHYFAQYGVMPDDNIVKLICPGSGELYLRADGFSVSSASDREGKQVEDRYVSGIFTDVSDFMSKDIIREAMFQGSDAVTFTADFRADTCSFSDNIDLIFPGARTLIHGDFTEEISQSIIPQDRKRFRNALHRVAHEEGMKFALEFRIKTTDGKIKWIACRGKSYVDRVHQTKLLIGVLMDLSKMNEMKETIESKESSHELTGLPTKNGLIHDCTKIIRNPSVLSASLIVTDIQNFHSFNDCYGKEVGDAIVSALAGYLIDNLPESANLYHIGVDSFALLWPNCTRTKVTEFLEKLSVLNSSPLVTTEGDFFVNLYIGTGMYPMADTSDELLSHAEIALHKAKETRDVKFRIFSPEDKNELDERLAFESEITQCINNKMENFQLYYQPLIDARSGALAGAEALLRWQSNDGRLVNPEIVVAALEKADKMVEVGKWIANEAIKQCAKWISRGAPSDFYIHINATADDLVRDDYADEIQELLKIYNLSSNNILIELTETSLMTNMAKCRKNLDRLKSMNIRTALDDFGSGYSSFNYLKELPVDEIKIDKTFVDDMETVEFSHSFISAMTILAHSIGKNVVVEGVESKSQAEMLLQIGADIFQGYYFGKPMSVFAFWNQYFA